MATILVADDLRLVRMVCRRHLEAAGHEVLEATDGAEAVKEYDLHRPAAVLLDLLMPEMDGLSALRAIRELDPNARVAMLTAEHDVERVTDAIQLGARDYVVKPFRPERLIQAVDRLLAR